MSLRSNETGGNTAIDEPCGLIQWTAPASHDASCRELETLAAWHF
jgi:hypothetical protein